MDWSMELKIARVKRHMTQVEVAEELGTTRKQIYLWETGQITPHEDNQHKIAEFIGKPVEALFKEETE